ncbi:thioredoxin family protein [Alcanivorax sp. S6407]|uniref:thioredoxin family protein n=1 Tax=Alcanivorax sp. S6407 TaxID=2926424 RepID=UPI001FF32BE2|nr:thioredoxin family protein [Alcanivorax sp. S6407]MCK0153031.1 thioredoxin family protein [Alcanivorax sp. S6407]
MQYQATYEPETLTRDQLDALEGLVVVEFGTNWCGHCQAAQSGIEQTIAALPQGRHIKVEDGPGRRLGRSFRVKLWPTLIVMKEGQELTRAVRPDKAALEALTAAVS